MRILIIGATRGIGKAILECALEETDIGVTVLARDPGKIQINHDKLVVQQGDAGNKDDVARCAVDQDVVISCIGVPITFQPVTLFSTTAANIVEAAKNNLGQKIICITGIGAGETKGHGGFLYDKIFNPLLLKTIYNDKDREEEIIRKSELEWLIVRPAGLTNGKRTGKYRVINDLTGVTSKRISRLDVADFILSQVRNPTEFGRTPLITY